MEIRYLGHSTFELSEGDARVLVDGELIIEVKQARTGVFRGIVYADYPKRSARSRGGIMKEES